MLSLRAWVVLLLLCATAVPASALASNSFGSRGGSVSGRSFGRGRRGRGTAVSRRGTSSNHARRNRQEEAEEERRADLFGAPGEWRARKRSDHLREWRSSEEERGDAMADHRHMDPTPAFEPKVWKFEAGGGKQASFFAQANDFASIGASDELQTALAGCGFSRPSHIQSAV